MRIGCNGQLGVLNAHALLDASCALSILSPRRLKRMPVNQWFLEPLSALPHALSFATYPY
jgi:hypothetical protein